MRASRGFGQGVSGQVGLSTLLRLISLIAIASGIFGIILAAGLVYLGMQAQLALEQAGRVADDRVRTVTAGISDIQAALRDAEVARQALLALDEGSHEGLQRAFRQRGVANMIDLRVFNLAIEEIEPGVFPDPDFAAIDMLIAARRDGQAPVQVHFPGTANENVAFAQRLDRDGQPAGVLLLRVPLSAVTSLLENPGALNYLALVQGRGPEATPLRAFGSPGAGELQIERIPNSMLAVHWSRTTVGGPAPGSLSVTVGGVGLLLLVIGFLLRSNALQKRLTRPSTAPTQTASPEAAVAETAPVANKNAASLDSAPERATPPPAPKPPPRPVAEPDTADLPEWLLDIDHDKQAQKTPPPPAPARDDDVDDLIDPLDEEILDELASESSGLSLERPDDLADTEEVFAADDQVPDTGLELDKGLDFELELEPEPLLEADSDPVESESLDTGLSLELEPEPDSSKSAQAETSLEPTSTVAPTEQAPTLSEPETAPADQDRPVAEPVPTASLIDRSLFRAHRIVGRSEDNLDARSATLIGQAIGSEARARGIERIAIGRDGRLFGAVLLSALSQGLRSAGLDVINLGALPVPALNLAANQWAGGSSVMVTGSHLPPDLNGLIIRLADEVLQDEAVQGLYDRIQRQDISFGSGEIEERNIVEDYIQRVASDIQLERRLKVVVDCGNGIAGTVVPAVLSGIGADVIPLYCDVDGNFPNHLPNPADLDNLEDLILCVRNFRADIGIAFDGDGDRIGVVSGDGEVIWPDRLLMLLAQDLLKRQPGAVVVHDVACSALLTPFIESLGGQTRVARSADSFVAEKMRESEASLAGLMSGHLFVAERWYPFDDGIYAAARLLELLAADTRSVAEILAELPNRKATPEYRVPMDEDDATDLVMALIAEGEFGEGRIDTMDGLRVEFDDGWGLVRASHRGPELVFRFEGEDSKVINRIQNLFRREIARQSSDITLLF